MVVDECLPLTILVQNLLSLCSLIDILFVFLQTCQSCGRENVIYFDGRFYNCHEGSRKQQREHNKMCQDCANGYNPVEEEAIEVCWKHGDDLRDDIDENTPRPQPVRKTH